MTETEKHTPDIVTSVLKFWHAVEFFVPFDLDDVISRPEAKYQLTEAQLEQHGNNALPWFSNRIFHYIGGDPLYEYRYSLYLLPFNKNEVTRLSRQIFPLDEMVHWNECLPFEFEERLDDEGLTCFARISIDVNACADLEKISLSTLPWALGQLLRRDLSAINQQSYDNEKIKLVAELNALSNAISRESGGKLTAEGILDLIRILKEWTGFSSQYPMSLVLETKQGKKKTLSQEQLELDNVNAELESAVEIEKVEIITDKINKIESEKIADIPSDDAVFIDCTDILNSFYIEDLERVINHVGVNKHEAMQCYIVGVSDKQKRDVYDEKNHEYMIQQLRADYLNQGRWPLPASQNMSLMQQLAIHECFHPSNESDLFSVNGPPGTGKTTLLQDIIAENIVQRACVLASFEISTAAFKENTSISFANEDVRNIQTLDPRLTGFEMIVVSSNNAAVENVSKELPLKRKIADEFQPHCHYLAPIASKLFADHYDKKVKPLKWEEKPWGLVAAALGNSTNRNRFVERVFFAPEGKDFSEERVLKGEYLTIWEWRKQYKGLSFAEAKNAFCEAKKQLVAYQDKIKNLLELYEKIKAFNKSNPLNTFNDQIINNKKSIIKQENQKAFEELSNEMPDIILPPSDGLLHKEAMQLSAFWIDETLNELRSTLFISALTLHEAWLADVLQRGFFTGNLCAISNLLSNKRPVNPEKELIIWQSLFMWVPVISSTFASIGRQFKNVGVKALGWFLMDETGQAIPQAVVGSIWRAQHVLMVGDPLQIEPVFTIPPNLVEGLAEHILAKTVRENNTLTQGYEKWLPTLTSAQVLADAGNTVGAYIDAGSYRQWIGCPLRVHRRCLEPMFSIANHIAYDNKMVQARIALDGENNLEKSLWYHVVGETSDKQHVPEQEMIVLKLFAAFYERAQGLPSVYIITPFKRVKYHLRRCISVYDQWKIYLNSTTPKPSDSELKKWCFRHIGTVHTFQGKEIDTVILVLGVDHKKQGAANWASSKPNLLNVALTRAKNTIYLVGDHTLWSRKPYFSDLANVLPCVSEIPSN